MFYLNREFLPEYKGEIFVNYRYNDSQNENVIGQIIE